MPSDDTSGRRYGKATDLGRRRVIRKGGAASALLVGGVTSVGGQSNRPTVTVSSPDCETLLLEYTQGGPPATVTVDGPERSNVPLSPGSSESLSVSAGSYTIEARPQTANETSQAENAITVEGTPVEVVDCVYDIDVDAQFSCSGGGSNFGIAYDAYNPNPEPVVLTRRAVAPDFPYTDTETHVIESGDEIHSSHYAVGIWDFDVCFTAETETGGELVLVNGEEEFIRYNPC